MEQSTNESWKVERHRRGTPVGSIRRSWERYWAMIMPKEQALRRDDLTADATFLIKSGLKLFLVLKKWRGRQTISIFKRSLPHDAVGIPECGTEKRRGQGTVVERKRKALGKALTAKPSWCPMARAFSYATLWWGNTNNQRGQMGKRPCEGGEAPIVHRRRHSKYGD